MLIFIYRLYLRHLVLFDYIEFILYSCDLMHFMACADGFLLMSVPALWPSYDVPLLFEL